MKSFEIAPERLELVAGRYAQIAKLCRIVQVQKLPARRSPKFRREGTYFLALSVIEEILSQSVGEADDRYGNSITEATCGDSTDLHRLATMDRPIHSRAGWIGGVPARLDHRARSSGRNARHLAIALSRRRATLW